MNDARSSGWDHGPADSRSGRLGANRISPDPDRCPGSSASLPRGRVPMLAPVPPDPGPVTGGNTIAGARPGRVSPWMLRPGFFPHPFYTFPSAGGSDAG